MNLLRAASTVSLFTLASRVTGLVRDVIVAAVFGAGAAADAFNVAFRIPNLLRRLFGEGAFSQAFVPILAATRETEGDAATRALVNAVATVLFWAVLATAVLGSIAAPIVVWIIASGLAQFDDAVVMTRIMFPYIAFISLVALSAGVLNTWRRFVVPAATPVLLNLAMIVCAALLAPVLARHGLPPIYSLAAGVMLGGVLQLGVQVPALARIGMLPSIALGPGGLRAAWHHPGVKRVLRQMAPALLGVSVAQLSILINTQIASHQGVGAVSWLAFADRLMEFPTALLGVALGVVLLPQLSALQARGDGDGYAQLLDWGLRLVVLLALPCAIALLVMPNALVATLFHYGRFDARDVQQTVGALMGYGAGLIGIVSVKILAPGFYAKQDIRTPVKIAVAVLLLTQALNLVLVPWFGHAGLALSIGLASLVNAGWLLVGLVRRGAYRPVAGWGRFLLQVLAGCVALGGVLALAAHGVDWIGLRSQPLVRIGWMALTIAGAAVVYFGVLGALGLRPRQFVRRG